MTAIKSKNKKSGYSRERLITDEHLHELTVAMNLIIHQNPNEYQIYIDLGLSNATYHWDMLERTRFPIHYLKAYMSDRNILDTLYAITGKKSRNAPNEEIKKEIKTEPKKYYKSKYIVV